MGACFVLTDRFRRQAGAPSEVALRPIRYAKEPQEDIRIGASTEKVPFNSAFSS